MDMAALTVIRLLHLDIYSCNVCRCLDLNSMGSWGQSRDYLPYVLTGIATCYIHGRRAHEKTVAEYTDMIYAKKLKNVKKE